MTRLAYGLIFLACWTALVSHALITAESSRLPAAENWRLTLREDPDSKLPLEPSCTGEAAITLACRAFILTLQNVSNNAVQILQPPCDQREVTVSRVDPNATGGWWPVSEPAHVHCETQQWTNLKLAPNGTVQYAFRLASPQRYVVEFYPGTYTLRAQWTLWGCTEPPPGTNCSLPAPGAALPNAYRADWEHPIGVVSNEITAISPPLPDFGAPTLSLEVKIVPGPPNAILLQSPTNRCTPEFADTAACVAFHATVRNLGNRAVMWYTASCSDAGIYPEYRLQDSGWKALPGPLVRACSANVSLPTPILPGAAAERDFTLATLQPGWNGTGLRKTDCYRLRFVLHATTCFSSPDGRFCLTQAQPQPPVASNELVVSQDACDKNSLQN